ncbi:MAG: DUF2164 domain-containing protein [Candidatus Latescibacterota bacterium]|nr:MAG: DUF2164 domain-containing protein [Candidatus Latescibacterota bacterium]
MALTISPEAKKRLIGSIKRYFEEHMDEEIGDLKADLLLDYFLKEIGPTVYNQAIANAQAFFQEKVADLDGSCYEPEFTFWKKG